MSNCHNYIIISVRRNCRELFLVSMFVSFEFILAGNECICTNVILLWSLHSSVLLSITMWLSVRRLAVSDRDSLAQYTCRCSIKYHMMSHWSALIIRVSYCKIVCLITWRLRIGKPHKRNTCFINSWSKNFHLKCRSTCWIVKLKELKSWVLYNLIFRPMRKYGSVSMVWHLTCCSHCFLCMVKQRIQYIDWKRRNKIQEFHKSCWILWRMEVRYSCKLLEIMSLPFWYCLHIFHLFLFVCLSLNL